MEKNNVQLAEPNVVYKNTEANILAISNPVEGMIAETTDTHKFLYYTGSDWINLVGFDNDIGFVPKYQTLFTFAGSLTVTNSPFRIYNFTPYTKTISRVAISVGTAPTGSAIIVDIHKDGTTIFTTQSNRPQIAISGFSGYSDTIEVSTWAPSSYLMAYIDQKGSTVAGSDLAVYVLTN